MKNNPSVLINSELPLPSFVKGKVRDIYDLGKQLLIVATDRISAFDVILPCGIPDKGRVLNQISAFWFAETKNIIPNHVIEMVNDVHVLDKYLPANKRFTYPEYLVGRSMIVKKVKRLSVECVVRGYLAGSAWVEYQKSVTAFGLPLPKGLLESQEFPEPLFTPTTKAETGHDLTMNMEALIKELGATLANAVKEKSLAIYNFARKQAIAKGIIIADTKFEFGLEHDKLSVIDEMLTPDSSRFWDVKLYKVGQSQPSYDKQPVRDWLTKSGWNKEPPAPMLPPEVIESTSRIYRTAYEKLTGKKLT
ncbi:MAG: phosphoribosylaminoimidazolesuccinocarboxamide synthase [Chloroflexi bacterium]|nr:phosphoribosylaminoimidazolesuccinocarboxamide synthase [Chloroflexota bacterium]